MDRKLIGLRQELEFGRRRLEHESQYKKYFEVKTTLKRGPRVTVNEEAFAKAKRYYG
ncbi:hypothetical protein [Desulfitobacterium sp. LBE]|uniref:hypothetical protein n=1 Tax=Desulfitobacterium sp. LBE TaxID=884086 RepID=UPI00155AED1E|nr:hypothetical protein [Desulfitobacterium sp. LBE]